VREERLVVRAARRREADDELGGIQPREGPDEVGRFGEGDAFGKAELEGFSGLGVREGMA
jgi:hypothetical protein